VTLPIVHCAPPLRHPGEREGREREREREREEEREREGRETRRGNIYHRTEVALMEKIKQQQ